MGGKKLDLRYITQKLRAFYQDYKRMPSFAELGELLGYSSKGAVRYVVQRLLEEGIVEQDDKGRLIPARLDGEYPLFGSIAAGFPSPAEEELIDTISFDQFLVSNPTATYMVHVTGDSMIEAGILPGDIAIVERGREPKNGDIVIAEVDHEYTMKFFEKKGKNIRLLPANKKYKPIEAQEELQIGGVVQAVVRKY